MEERKKMGLRDRRRERLSVRKQIEGEKEKE